MEGLLGAGCHGRAWPLLRLDTRPGRQVPRLCPPPPLPATCSLLSLPQLLEFDKELAMFRGQLQELDINFPPR